MSSPTLMLLTCKFDFRFSLHKNLKRLFNNSKNFFYLFYIINFDTIFYFKSEGFHRKKRKRIKFGVLISLRLIYHFFMKN